MADKKRVYIVGCADSKDLTPKNDPDAEYWGVNNLWVTMPKGDSTVNPMARNWTRWFEIHKIEKMHGAFHRRGSSDFRGQKVDDYINQLAKLDTTVIMQQHWDEIPKSVAYPIKEITQVFGNYFTNTVSYEIALAIFEKFEEIHVYGVDMATSSKLLESDEYSLQRPSCEYFLGWAKGTGIKVVIPDEADLLKSRFMYGYDEVKQAAFEKKLSMMMGSLDKRRRQAEEQKHDCIAKEYQYIGAIQAAKEIKKIWD